MDEEPWSLVNACVLSASCTVGALGTILPLLSPLSWAVCHGRPLVLVRSTSKACVLVILHCFGSSCCLSPTLPSQLAPSHMPLIWLHADCTVQLALSFQNVDTFTLSLLKTLHLSHSLQVGIRVTILRPRILRSGLPQFLSSFAHGLPILLVLKVDASFEAPQGLHT